MMQSYKNTCCTIMFWRLTFILILLLPAVYAFCQKGQLTGNWGGARDSLQKNGLIIQPRLTLFQQNFVPGTGDNKSVFAGKADLMIKFNGQKLGLKKWTLVTHIEQNFGETLNQKGGVLIPSNTATTFPGLEGSKAFDISSLHLVHQFGKANVLMFGKINMVDVADGTRFSGGAGIDAFWNVNFAAPVSGILPPYMFGAISIIKTDALKYTFMVYDPRNYANRFPTPFERGVSFNMGVEKELSIAGKKGTHAVSFRYSTQDGADLYDLGDINLPSPEDSLGRENDRWYINYVFNQTLFAYSEKGKGWGLFGQVGVSDGNPNPIRFGMHLGVGGNSFFKGRSNDRWGLAFYNYSLSVPLEDFGASYGYPIRNETGIELFYQAWITHYLSLGADVQWVNPVVKNNDPALLPGIRTSIRI
jgi:porin